LAVAVTGIINEVVATLE